jgi:hypothetical protein
MKGGTAVIETKHDAVVFSFPEVHSAARCTVVFQRTLRVPPGRRGRGPSPGLGRYSLHVANLPGRVSREIRGGEGIVFPMYQSEAFLIILIGRYPCAVSVTREGKNVLTGRTTRDERLWRPGDYVTFPRHPLTEWFCFGGEKEKIFAAAPLGGGETGLTITVLPMSGPDFERYRAAAVSTVSAQAVSPAADSPYRGEPSAPSLKGAFFQPAKGNRCTVSPLDTVTYRQVTGRPPGGKPLSISDYLSSGVPWKKEYGEDGSFPCVGQKAGVC